MYQVVDRVPLLDGGESKEWRHLASILADIEGIDFMLITSKQ